MTAEISINVTFVDADTNQVMGEMACEASRLPETFEKLETTLHLGDADWFVVDAEPMSRPEYILAGELKLHLRRVQRLDPSKILYSLPSLCDLLPPLDESRRTGDEFEIHEDDWRQFELVLALHAQRCDKEIEAIRHIHENESAEMGWRKVHPRENPDPPIDRRFSTEQMLRHFSLAGPLRGVAFDRTEFVIRDAWAFTASDGMQFYGLSPGGKVSVIGIVQERLPDVPRTSIESLKSLAAEFELELVYWNRCTRASVSDPLFSRLIVENSGHEFSP